MGTVTRIIRDPLAGVTRLVVDGTNLLHALRRGSEPAPSSALVGRLRAMIPPEISVEVWFDGSGPGGAVQKATSGVVIRFSGRRSADALILDLAEPAGMLVVTDDRELRELLGARGTATARTAWLVRRLERGRLLGPSVGNRRPPVHHPSGSTVEPEREPWKPGRGATRKRGNPKRRRAGGEG
jgi:hypothetical protein